MPLYTYNILQNVKKSNLETIDYQNYHNLMASLSRLGGLFLDFCNS